MGIAHLNLFDAILRALDDGQPAVIDLLGALDVLHDQATSHFCGTDAGMAMPLTAGDVLELVLSLSTLTDDQIRRKPQPTKIMPTYAKWRPDKYRYLHIDQPPAVTEGDVLKWKPWL